jgi:hypothetical protein
MKHEKTYTPLEQQQVSEAQSGQTVAREFASVEEMLRYDAKQAKVPPGIASRLNQTLRNEARPGRPWWRRLLGGQ